MRTWTRAALALVVGMATPLAVWAQVPGVPGGAPGAPGVNGGAALGTGVGPAAPTSNIWSFFCMTPEQKAGLKACFCSSPFGAIANSMGKPISMATGGLFGNCCPTNAPNPEDLKKSAESNEGAAALIKKDEKEAKARREAVRYLGTVDCNWWPEAEAALINSLRGDRNECVRWEAALALQHGCCCTIETMKALADCVAGKKTKFPAEHSDRVREAAAVALSMCVVETPAGPPAKAPEEIKPPMEKDGPGNANGNGKSVYNRAEVIQYARQVLSLYYNRPISQIVAGSAPPTTRPGAHGLFGIVAQSLGTPVVGYETPAPGLHVASGDTERSGVLYMAYSWMHGNGSASYSAPTISVQPMPVTATAPGSLGPIVPTGGAAPKSSTGYIEWDR